MLICPACQHQNIDGTQFCEMCGEELPQKVAAASDETLVPCPDCAHLNPADNMACEACGADLKPGAAPDLPVSAVDAGIVSSPVPAADTEAETTPFDTPQTPPSSTPAPSAPLPAGNLAPGSVKLVVEQGQSVGAQFVLGDAEMLVGREDEDEEIYPDIDLSDQDAGYVHRKHATLNFDNGNLSVTHLGGSNKTRVNNKPVSDNVPSPVVLGDKIAFGKVVLRLLPV